MSTELQQKQQRFQSGQGSKCAVLAAFARRDLHKKRFVTKVITTCTSGTMCASHMIAPHKCQRCCDTSASY
eukprot:9334029-Karenia_brevis.AAC.1